MLRNIKSLLVGLIVLSFMVGCGGSRPAPTQTKHNSTTKTHFGKTIYINPKAIYTGYVAPNIKKECRIDTQVIEWIKRYAAKQNINVIVGGKPKAHDMVLKIYITDAVSSGNAFTGHRKYVIIKGKLYKGKRLKATFKAARRSGGGYFGAYRSSCSVLGSCAKTLGKDTAYWLTDPVNKARLGDVYLLR